MFNDKVAGYEELFSKVGLANLQNKGLQDVAILVYKAKHSLTYSILNRNGANVSFL